MRESAEVIEMTCSQQHKQYLQYVLNTNGGATKGNFVEDWEPIGERVWDDLWGAELIEFDGSLHVRLTKKGHEFLSRADV